MCPHVKKKLNMQATLLVVLAALAGCAVAYPSGQAIGCNKQLPGPSWKQTDAKIMVNCVADVCILTLDGMKSAFLGVKIYSDNGFVATDDSNLITKGACLLHKDSQPKFSVTFRSTGPETMTAFVVTRGGAVHQGPAPITFTTGREFLPDMESAVHIVGAGPGGIAAAMYLAQEGVNVELYEMGGDEPGLRSGGDFYLTDFYNAPIAETYNSRANLSKCNIMGIETDADGVPVDSNYQLACLVGGNQNINGAVYAPGYYDDLAKSLGINNVEANIAQNRAARYVEDYVDEFGMMWACVGQPCDRVTVASSNMVQKRRSLAHSMRRGNIERIRIHTACRATSVAGGVLALEGTGCPERRSVSINEKNRVILAAGALSTPQILGNTTFEGYNHYYKVKTTAPFKEPEFDFFFEGDEKLYEVNRANIRLENGSSLGIEITMLMTPGFREKHTVGQMYSPPEELGEGYAQAWHFMGTVRHTSMLVDGHDFVYVGDASALQTPFNCHTSMPAAAAGVAAARAALGQTVIIEESFDKIQNTVPVLFITGSGILVVGVAVHRTRWRVMHYVLQWTGIVVVGLGILNAAQEGNLENGHYHRVWGVTVGVWLLVQAAAGSYIYAARSMGRQPGAWMRWGHRLSGGLLIVNVASLGITGAQLDVLEEKYKNFSVPAATAVAAVYTAVSAGLLALVVRDFAATRVQQVQVPAAARSLL